MDMKKIIINMLIAVLVLGATTGNLYPAKKVKNIIIMVPDGMGLADVTAARIYLFGPDKTKHLYLESLENIGYQSTFSANSIVTDSAAAASTWACGQKFNNNEISFHKSTQTAPKSILQIAKELGKSTGLVATSTITHATPGAFGAHVENRKCENEIARQYIAKTGVDVLLGGGRGTFKTEEKDKDPCGTYGDFIKMAEEKGYKTVYNREEMLKNSRAKKLLGLFSHMSLSPDFRRQTNENTKQEPSLEEMTQTALQNLEQNDNGFFLMVEGSQVDWANHANNLEYQISEVLAFDRAVKCVIDWLDAKKSRQKETLLIVVPDHDCGGFAVKGPYDQTFDKPGQMVEPGWVWGNHTGVDTTIWSQGPYSEHLGKAIDNTDVFYIMKAAFMGQEYQKSR